MVEKGNGETCCESLIEFSSVEEGTAVELGNTQRCSRFRFELEMALMHEYTDEIETP